jgi:hypothetical protein
MIKRPINPRKLVWHTYDGTRKTLPRWAGREGNDLVSHYVLIRCWSSHDDDVWYYTSRMTCYKDDSDKDDSDIEMEHNDWGPEKVKPGYMWAYVYEGEND